MNDLPKYDPESTCPKCGFDKVSTRHERGGDPFASLAMSLGQRLTTVEHIRRACARCGYAWAQAPLAQGRGE